ncbi:unnamed protein product [Lepidochelys kempii]
MTCSSWSRTQATWCRWRLARPSTWQPPPPGSTGSRALAWWSGLGGRRAPSHPRFNLLLALAKVAIYTTRKRMVDERELCDCGAYFRSSLVSHIRAEFLWAASAGSLDTFEEQWALSGVLCSVSPSGSLCLAL